MRRHWRSGISQLSMALLGLLVLGWMFDAALLFLFLGMSTYIAWSTWQLVRLHRWLDEKTGVDPPESVGLWGDVFDGIYQLQRKQKKSRKRLRQIIKRVQSSMSALRDGVVMIDSNRSLEWWNESAEAMFGFQNPADRGQHITNLLRIPEFITYFERGDYLEPLEIQTPLNPDMTVQIVLTEFGKKDYLMIARDVTRVRKLEQMRRDFIANMSHELKTPLTVLRGYMETLLSSDALDERLQDILREMDAQGVRMDNLIRDLLYLSRLENEPMPEHVREVDMPGLLRRVEREASAIAQAKNQSVELILETQHHLKGSEAELYSAISNLALNATKYTGENGKISIIYRMNKKDVEVRIRDNGPGIEFQHLNRLTERFYRVDKHRSIASGGTGLGLAIVKHVLVRHDAILSIRSTPGHGSTFICTFPKHMVKRIPGQKKSVS